MSNLTREEDFTGVKHPGDDIVCKDCKFKSDGTVYSNDYRKVCCQKFPWPKKIKPTEVLFKNAKCPEYEKEETEEK